MEISQPGPGGREQGEGTGFHPFATWEQNLNKNKWGRGELDESWRLSSCVDPWAWDTHLHPLPLPIPLPSPHCRHPINVTVSSRCSRHHYTTVKFDCLFSSPFETLNLGVQLKCLGWRERDFFSPFVAEMGKKAKQSLGLGWAHVPTAPLQILKGRHQGGWEHGYIGVFRSPSTAGRTKPTPKEIK